MGYCTNPSLTASNHNSIRIVARTVTQSTVNRMGRYGAFGIRPAARRGASYGFSLIPPLYPRTKKPCQIAPRGLAAYSLLVPRLLPGTRFSEAPASLRACVCSKLPRYPSPDILQTNQLT